MYTLRQLKAQWKSLAHTEANTSFDHVAKIFLAGLHQEKDKQEYIARKLKEHFAPIAKHNLPYPGKWYGGNVWGQQAYVSLTAELYKLVQVGVVGNKLTGLLELIDKDQGAREEVARMAHSLYQRFLQLGCVGDEVKEKAA